MFLFKGSKEQADENPVLILVFSLSFNNHYFRKCYMSLPSVIPHHPFTIWSTPPWFSPFHCTGCFAFFTSEPHALCFLPLLLLEHWLPCCPSLHCLPLCLFTGCALLVSFLCSPPKLVSSPYSPLRNVVLVDASHLNLSWISFISKSFLNHSMKMSRGREKSSGSETARCSSVPGCHKTYSLSYLYYESLGDFFPFPKL